MNVNQPAMRVDYCRLTFRVSANRVQVELSRFDEQANVRTSQLLGTCSLWSERPRPTTRP